MQVLTNPGDFALFKTTEPYYRVTQVRDYTAEISGTVAATEFRWSIDGVTYSAWIELTTDNLRDLTLNPEEAFWIEFRVTLVSGGPVNVGTFTLELDTQAVDKYKGILPVGIDCAETGNITSITRIQDLCFQPYAVNPAICLYNDLNYMVNNLFGHQVEYFRAVPDKRAQDVTLMEYTLYDVSPSKCVKVMVPNNEFPDSKLAYNPFGIDFEQPFEVQIDKHYWEEIFGHDTGPQKRDIIYFPLNNRVYEVLSSYLFKGFMQQDTYWKVSLVKYQPKSNRYEPEGVRQVLDDLTTDVTEQFEESLRETEEQITKPQQYNYFIGNREYDPSRESIDKDIKVIEQKLVNYSTLVAEFHYSLMNLVNFTTPKTAVQYREPVIFPVTAERSYSSWFSPKQPLVFVANDVVNNMVLIGNTLTLQLASVRNYVVGDIIKVSRPGGITFYGTVSNVVNTSTYDITLETEVLNTLNTISPMWTGMTGYKAERTVYNNFINGYDSANTKGVRIDMVANRYFIVNLNGTKHIFALDRDLTNDKWYAIHLNISSKFKQININIWERKWQENVPSSSQTTELFNTFNKTINNVTIPDCTAGIKYSLMASNMLLTNIRLYDQTAEIEKQAIMLNQNIVQDSQRAIIIDNALPKLKLPFIGQSK